MRIGIRTRRNLAGASAVIALALLLYNLRCLWRLRVTRLRIVMPGLPPELDGLRLAHLTDFHLRQPGTSRGVIEAAVERSVRFEPDIVALTGDYVDGPHSERHASLFSRWPCDTPVVAVLGNHDFERGEAHLARTIDMLESAGVTLLRNDATKLRARGTHIWVAGIEDPFTVRDDVSRAYAPAPACERVLLLLAHAPVLQALGDIDRTRLVLCGHTHGGQVRLLPSGRMPFSRLMRRLTRENGPRRDPDLFRGWHLIGSTVLVISEGLGVSLLPLRFRTQPQLTLIELATGRSCQKKCPPGQPGCKTSLRESTCLWEPQRRRYAPGIAGGST